MYKSDKSVRVSENASVPGSAAGQPCTLLCNVSSFICERTGCALCLSSRSFVPITISFVRCKVPNVQERISVGKLRKL